MDPFQRKKKKKKKKKRKEKYFLERKEENIFHTLRNGIWYTLALVDLVTPVLVCSVWNSPLCDMSVCPLLTSPTVVFRISC